MLDINLAQHAQNLKSLQQSLLKICEEYQHAQKSLIDLQAQVRRVCHQLNQSSQVFDLIILIDEMIDDVAAFEFESKESES